MVKYRDYYIAFLDILGFSDLVNTEKAEVIHSVFSRIKQAEILTTKYPVTENQIGILQKNTKFLFFSDTIVCAIPCDLAGAFEMVTSNCMLIQHALFSSKTPILLRGAIVKGKLFIDGNEMFGPGLIEAYRLEESLAKYPRIIMTCKTYEDGIAASNENEEIIYISHTNDGLIEVEIFKYLDEANQARLHDLIISKIATEIDVRVREKYLWLKDHYNSFTKEKSGDSP